jgi:hypothetical protein
MNDFTKKELIALEQAIHNVILEYCPNDLETSKLYKKLNLMIENYCEHTYGVIYIEGSAYPRCKKCNRIPRTSE